MPATYVIGTDAGGLRIQSVTAAGVALTLLARPMFILHYYDASAEALRTVLSSDMTPSLVSNTGSTFQLRYTMSGGYFTVDLFGTLVGDAVNIRPKVQCSGNDDSEVWSLDSIELANDFASPAASGANVVAIVPRGSGERVLDPETKLGTTGVTYSTPGTVLPPRDYGFLSYVHIYDGDNRDGFYFATSEIRGATKDWFLAKVSTGVLTCRIKLYPPDNRLAQGASASYEWDCGWEIRPMVGDYWTSAEHYRARMQELGHIGFAKGKVWKRRDIPDDFKDCRLWLGIAAVHAVITDLPEIYTRIFEALSPPAKKHVAEITDYWNSSTGPWPDVLPVIDPVGLPKLAARIRKMGAIFGVYVRDGVVGTDSQLYATGGVEFHRDAAQDPLVVTDIFGSSAYFAMEDSGERIKYAEIYRTLLVGIFGEHVDLVFHDIQIGHPPFDSHNLTSPATSRGPGGYGQFTARRAMAQTQLETWNQINRSVLHGGEFPQEVMLGSAHCFGQVNIDIASQVYSTAARHPLPLTTIVWGQYCLRNPFDAYGLAPNQGWCDAVKVVAMLHLHAGMMFGMAVFQGSGLGTYGPSKPGEPGYLIVWKAFEEARFRLLQKCVAIPRESFHWRRMRALPGTMERWIERNDFTFGAVIVEGIPTPVLPVGLPAASSSVWFNEEDGRLSIKLGNHTGSAAPLAISMTNAEWPGCFSRPAVVVSIDPLTKAETKIGTADASGLSLSLTIPPDDVMWLQVRPDGYGAYADFAFRNWVLGELLGPEEAEQSESLLKRGPKR